MTKAYNKIDYIRSLQIMAGIRSLDEPLEDGSSLHDIIPSEVDVERQVMARFTFKSLPKIIKRIGVKRLAGFRLTNAEQTYWERWRKNEMPAFRKEWEI